MDVKSFHISVQGASHIKKNKECQDASTSYTDETVSLAVVCDGHGGDDYVRSAIGSKYASEIAERNIRDFCSHVERDALKHHSEKLIATLEGSIINDWNEAVNKHFSENPLSEAEISVLSEKAKRRYLNGERIESAYGTTLIAVAVTTDFWFGIHIGDGKCVAVSPEGRFVQPIPWDDKCFLNATTSICDTDALNNFRHFYSEKLPVAVFVGSDGIDDCFKNSQQLNSLYKTILYSFTTSEFCDAVKELKDYLPRLSAKGSGDDVSIAAVLDMEKIGEIESVKEFDREKEKARVTENARKEAEKAEEERQRVEREHASASEQKHPKVTLICRNCGSILLNGAKYCAECGEMIRTDSEDNTVGEIETGDGIQRVEIGTIESAPAVDTSKSSENSEEVPLQTNINAYDEQKADLEPDTAYEQTLTETDNQMLIASSEQPLHEEADVEEVHIGSDYNVEVNSETISVEETDESNNIEDVIEIQSNALDIADEFAFNLEPPADQTSDT